MKLYKIPHSRVEYHSGEALVRARNPEEAVDFFDDWLSHEDNIIEHPDYKIWDAEHYYEEPIEVTSTSQKKP